MRRKHAQRHYHHRQWWFRPRAPLFWITFLGCPNWEAHLTWRDA